MAYIGAQPRLGNFQACDAITASATTTFNLLVGGTAIFPQTAQHCLVSLNGVLQAPISSYTISGSTIVFASALTSADSIDFITILGDTLDLGVPSDSTVTTAKLASDIGISTTGNIATTSSGTMTSAGLITASSGVAIGGTGAANTLDDYEEGTYTPTVTDSAGNVTITLNSSYNLLSYTKIGRTCYIAGVLVVSGISGSWSGGETRITLPFATPDLTDQAGKSIMPIGIYNTDLTNSGTYAYLSIGEGDSHGGIHCARDNGTTGAGQVSSSAQLYLGSTYITA